MRRRGNVANTDIFNFISRTIIIHARRTVYKNNLLSASKFFIGKLKVIKFKRLLIASEMNPLIYLSDKCHRRLRWFCDKIILSMLIKLTLTNECLDI